jgi:dihydroorotate dehydrogenase
MGEYMAENPKITVVRESVRNIREGELEEAAHILHHEGLKRSLENSLYYIALTDIGRTALSKLAGGPFEDSRLRTSIGGLDLKGPVGLAPGWDKTGRGVLAMNAIGADFQVPGAFTWFEQAGQRMPRLFTFDEQIGDRGKSKSLNRYGFYNPGVRTGVYNLLRLRERTDLQGPIIGQVTLNKEFYEEANKDMIPQAVRQTVAELLPAVDGINLGLSSPNTKGMREAQNAHRFLYEIIMGAQDEIHRLSDKEVPLFVKGDGDGGTDRLDIYCELARESGCNLELINTTGLERIKSKYGAENEAGGLAGADPDYRNLAVDSVRYVYEQVGDKIDIVGVGGIGGPEVEGGLDQAISLMEAGANAVEFNTYFRTGGIRSFTNIKRGMAIWLDRQSDISNISEIIGRRTQRGPKIQQNKV